MDIALLILATWRLSHFLVREGAPFDAMHVLRHAIGVRFNEHSQPVAKNVVAEIFACVHCMSVWVAALLWFVTHAGTLDVIGVLAISGGAILVDRYFSRSD